MDRISCGQNCRTWKAQTCRYKTAKMKILMERLEKPRQSRVPLPYRRDGDPNGMLRFGILRSPRASESGIVIVEPFDNLNVPD